MITEQQHQPDCTAVTTHATALQDARDMVEIFTGKMAFLFGALLADPALVHLLSQLLIQTTVSRHIAPILLQYLVEHRLKELQQPSSKVGMSSVELLLLRLHHWSYSLCCTC